MLIMISAATCRLLIPCTTKVRDCEFVWCELVRVVVLPLGGSQTAGHKLALASFEERLRPQGGQFFRCRSQSGCGCAALPVAAEGLVPRRAPTVRARTGSGSGRSRLARGRERTRPRRCRIDPPRLRAGPRTRASRRDAGSVRAGGRQRLPCGLKERVSVIQPPGADQRVGVQVLPRPETRLLHGFTRHDPQHRFQCPEHRLDGHLELTPTVLGPCRRSRIISS